VDLRWIGHGRPTLKDPSHPAWPEGGRRTEDEREATRWAAVYVERYRGARPVRRLGASIEAYLRHRARISPSRTLAAYSTALRHLTDRYPETHAVAEIDPQQVVNALLDEGYRPSTVRSYVTGWRGLWQWLDLPFPAVTMPRTVQTDVRYWTDAEVAKLRRAAARLDPELLVALDCTLYMGLRVGEVFGLRWEDVAGDTVRVQRQILQGRTTPSPLKSGKPRTALILPGWTHEGTSGPVVPAGRVVQFRWIRALLDAAGLNAMGAGWHMGRHTYARLCLEAGMGLDHVRIFLGHASIVTTQRTYGHLRDDPALALARKAIRG
jgi:integrase